jgi:hypothetical protein
VKSSKAVGKVVAILSLRNSLLYYLLEKEKGLPLLVALDRRL